MCLSLIEIGRICKCFRQRFARFELFEPNLKLIFDHMIVSERSTRQFQRSTREIPMTLRFPECLKQTFCKKRRESDVFLVCFVCSTFRPAGNSTFVFVFIVRILIRTNIFNSVVSIGIIVITKNPKLVK